MEFRRHSITKSKKNVSGFTLIELLVAFSIFSLLVAITAPTYQALKKHVAVKNDSFQIANALRMAQNRSIISQGGTKHGVHFSTSTYELFEGDWSTSSPKTVYQLVQGIKIIDGAGDTVSFDKLTGETSSTAISVGTSDENKKTISIDKAGNIRISQ